jgi:deoxyhypusine synthase
MSSAQNNSVEAPKGATDAVLVQSEEMPADTPLIEGPDFNKVLSLSDLLATYKYMGFQASGLGKAIDIVEKMVSLFGYRTNCITSCSQIFGLTEEVEIVGRTHR